MERKSDFKGLFRGYFKGLLPSVLLGSLIGPVWGADPKIHPLPINSNADEDLPYYNQGISQTVPGRLYFSRKVASGKWDLYWARYDTKKKALGNAELVGPNVQTDMDDLGAVVTPEGRFPQFMVYATKKDKFSPSTDIFISIRDGEDRVFGPVRPVAATASKDDESEPWIHVATDKKNTLHLYYTKKTKEGTRIFLSVGEAQTRSSLANFSGGKLVESIPTGFSRPTLMPDGKKMFLQGPVKGGTQGIFITYFSGGSWSAPLLVEQLSYPDARVGSVSPALTRDGKALYFASDKPGGKGGLDLYWVLVSELTLPK